jgi:dTDP-4-dehydrorhamnose reductase
LSRSSPSPATSETPVPAPLDGEDQVSISGLVLGASGFIGRRVLARLGPGRGLGTYSARAFETGVPFDAARQGLDDLLSRAPAGLTHVFMLHGLLEPARIASDAAAAAAINVAGVQSLAQTCFREGLVPVFFSTDYVFDGTRGFWTEEDAPAPLTAYGRQKAEVEAWFAGRREPALVLRLSKVVSAVLEPRNILAEWLEAMQSGAPIRCAYDQTLSPLCAGDAAGAAIALASAGATGLFNLAGPEAFTRLALLRLLTAHVAAVAPAVQARIEPCRLADLAWSEPRPLDTSLDIDKLQRTLGWRFRPMSDVCAELVGLWSSRVD